MTQPPRRTPGGRFAPASTSSDSSPDDRRSSSETPSVVPDAAEFSAAPRGGESRRYSESSSDTDGSAGSNAVSVGPALSASVIINEPYICHPGSYHFVHFLHKYVDRPPDLGSGHDGDLELRSSEARACFFADTLSRARRAHSQGGPWPPGVPFLRNSGEQLVDSGGTYLSWVPTLRTNPRSPMPPPYEQRVKATLMHMDICWCGLSMPYGHLLAPRRAPRWLETFREQGPPRPPGPRLEQGRLVQSH